MRSTYNTHQGLVITSFGGTCPYFWLCFLFIWQDLQDLTYDRIVLLIPFGVVHAYVDQKVMPPNLIVRRFILLKVKL
jgi:hypothetical protein